MLTKNNKKKNWLKSKIANFTILLTNLVETLPRSMHDFWGGNLIFCPIWSHVNEHEKKKKK